MRVFTALLLLLSSSTLLLAQGPGEYLYTFSENGRLFVNATLLEKLPSNYAPTDVQDAAGGERWTGLEAVGADRYALRVDGRYELNGSLIKTLPTPFSTAPLFWVALEATEFGVFALRTDGILSRNGSLQAGAPSDNSFFYDLAETGEEVFMMRLDGAVFVDSAGLPGFQLRGTLPAEKGDPIPADDGTLLGNRWIRITRDPSDGTLVALREDGVIFRMNPANAATGGAEAAPGNEIARLPRNLLNFHPSQRYVDLEVDATGEIFVLRGDGALFSSTDIEEPIVDYAPDFPDGSKRFRDLAVGDGKQWVLRYDGRIYLGDDLDPLVTLKKNGFFTLELSEEAPDFDEFKDRRPKITGYRTTVVEGTDVAVPIRVTDIDEPGDAGLVTTFSENKKSIGLLAYDEEEESVSFTEAVPPGKYGFKIEILEADTGKKRRKKYSVRVLTPDENPDKNKKPLRPKVQRAQLLVGEEFVLPLIFDDRDPDDALTVTPMDDGDSPFAGNAVYDAPSGEIRWTPEFKDIGKHTLTLFVSDATKVVKLKVRVTVVNPLPIPTE